MPQLLTIIACCLFVVAFAKVRQQARQRPAQLARMQPGLTTQEQARSALGKPIAQTLARDGSVTMHWSRRNRRSSQPGRVQHTQIEFDPQGVARQICDR